MQLFQKQIMPETAEVKQYDKFGNVIQTSKNIGVGGNLLKIQALKWTHYKIGQW